MWDDNGIKPPLCCPYFPLSIPLPVPSTPSTLGTVRRTSIEQLHYLSSIQRACPFFGPFTPLWCSDTQLKMFHILAPHIFCSLIVNFQTLFPAHIFLSSFASLSSHLFHIFWHNPRKQQMASSFKWVLSTRDWIELLFSNNILSFMLNVSEAPIMILLFVSQ